MSHGGLGLFEMQIPGLRLLSLTDALLWLALPGVQVRPGQMNRGTEKLALLVALPQASALSCCAFWGGGVALRTCHSRLL